jgi:hypothetical protein
VTTARGTQHPLAAALDGFIDDAAVFPPGNAPLAAAVDAHLARRRSPDGRYVGPLLVPASAAAAVSAQLAAAHRVDDPLDVVLIARPGTPAPSADDVALLGPSVRLAGVELGWSPSWRTVLDLGVPVAVEIPRPPDHRRALDDLAGTPGVRAKFRTGATPQWAWPTEVELAHVLQACADRGVTLKLTGGLHHAVRADHPDPQHGLLNVLVAVAATRAFSEIPSIAAVLSIRDAGTLVATLTELQPEAIDGLRHTLAGFGCCDVTDPLRELAALALIPPSEESS